MFMISNSRTDAAIIRAAQEGNTLVRVTARVYCDTHATALNLARTREKYGLVLIGTKRYFAASPAEVEAAVTTAAYAKPQETATKYEISDIEIYWYGQPPREDELDEIAAALTGTAIGGIMTITITSPEGEETETTTLAIPEILPKWWEWDARTVRRHVTAMAPEPVKNAINNYLLWALPTSLPETGEVIIR